ncbi:hypothetical protein QO010_004126 [Caulobacter ginsengisoli]|uniref:ABC-three component systems C-terminal domain-containing protein n=1 Tax=Caulobacter ginsengisoli TaxID=400775 RepID=A0ABU0IYT4_9CAUL|nr:ABC-three component system protein [Caulobacter ginsengisoli]MDQ0466333.1 hypothetical protein [Caulobacter ginsengisoli]
MELKLRQASGDAFQDLFSRLMARLHGDDFVRVRPFGSLGDKGCDGYLISDGKVFQCYGALGGDKGKVESLIEKMDEDFEKAKQKLPHIMKEWHMVHNIVDGLPVHAVEKLEALKKANPNLKFGFIGFEGFIERLFKLPKDDIENFVGPVVTNQDAVSMQLPELRDLVAAVAAAADAVTAGSKPIKPVPVDKLELNKLPGHWRSLIAGGWQNAHHVRDYIAKHHNPMLGETLAGAFQGRYQYLKAQLLEPAAIMYALYVMVTGPGESTPQRQVAAQALLAYLFESCDIFEDAPSEATA